MTGVQTCALPIYSDNEAINRKDKMLTTGENMLINDGVARLEMIERK